MSLPQDQRPWAGAEPALLSHALRRPLSLSFPPAPKGGVPPAMTQNGDYNFPQSPTAPAGLTPLGWGRAAPPLTCPPPPTFTVLPPSAQGGVPPAVTQITAAGLQRHGAGAPSLHFHSPTRRNSCCISAARGECPLPLCCHSVTRCGLLQDRATTTESLPRGATGPALPLWHLSGGLF